jgi:hypothetical protein
LSHVQHARCRRRVLSCLDRRLRHDGVADSLSAFTPRSAAAVVECTRAHAWAGDAASEESDRQ